ncbi:MAG: DNA-binding response regulator [Lactobacillus sp.]|jgi:two-component system response regulator AgrA|nr:DNA-binding response regulator [Lactobacillus sp.]
MIDILILEDTAAERLRYADIIKKRIEVNPSDHPYDMRLALATAKPREILDYIQSHAEATILAVLDIHIQDDALSGIDIAETLRHAYPLANIVFITTHDDLLPLTLKRKVAPLDFIYKETGAGEIKTSLRQDVDVVHHWYQQVSNTLKTHFTYEALPGVYRKIDFADIDYFQTQPGYDHQLLLVGKGLHVEFRGELAQLAAKYPKLMRCDRGYLLNPDNMTTFDAKKRLVYFDQAKTISCKVSTRKINDVLDFFKSH